MSSELASGDESEKMDITDITGKPYAEFDELKKKRSAILSIQGMRHISGMKLAFDAKCSLMMTVDALYFDEMYGSSILLTNNNVVLPMSYIKNIELMDREGLAAALERDKGNPFYQYLAYGKPGLLQEEGFKKPSFLSKFSPCVLAIEQGNFYGNTSTYSSPMNTAVRNNLLSAQRYGTNVSQDKQHYDNRNKKYDYFCFKVKKTSTIAIKHGIIEQFKEIKRNTERQDQILGRRT